MQVNYVINFSGSEGKLLQEIILLVAGKFLLLQIGVAYHAVNSVDSFHIEIAFAPLRISIVVVSTLPKVIKVAIGNRG